MKKNRLDRIVNLDENNIKYIPVRRDDIISNIKECTLLLKESIAKFNDILILVSTPLFIVTSKKKKEGK